MAIIWLTLLTVVLLPGGEKSAIGIYPENPFYWEYGGKPTLQARPGCL